MQNHSWGTSATLLWTPVYGSEEIKNKKGKIKKKQTLTKLKGLALHWPNSFYTPGGITKSLTLCPVCFCTGKCSIYFLQNLYFGTCNSGYAYHNHIHIMTKIQERRIVSTFPNIVNQNKPNILSSHPVYISLTRDILFCVSPSKNVLQFLLISAHGKNLSNCKTT